VDSTRCTEFEGEKVEESRSGAKDEEEEEGVTTTREVRTLLD
jgi:hypothetical protein